MLPGRVLKYLLFFSFPSCALFSPIPRSNRIADTRYYPGTSKQLFFIFLVLLVLLADATAKHKLV